jgi:hypothetical protein
VDVHEAKERDRQAAESVMQLEQVEEKGKGGKL